MKVDIPFFEDPVLLKEEIWRAKEKEGSTIHSKWQRRNHRSDSPYIYIRQSAQYLRSSSGCVWENYPGRYPETQRVMGKPGAPENPENHVNATRNVEHKSNFSDRCRSTGKPDA